jgi:sphingolipid 8-(E)-desaturase
MARYRIGRIEGHWKNFSPPIQGGRFRTRVEIEEDDILEAEADSIKGQDSSSSRSPSPVFDDDENGVRRRRRAAGQTSPSEASPAPSSKEEVDDGMSFLDTLTRQHISLDLDKYPALDSETQTNIVAKYRELHQRIRDAGLYKCNYWAYAVECARYMFLLISMFACLHYGWPLIGAVCLGLMWHQLVFTAHDAGHMGITHNYHIDTLIGIFIADFMGGLSLGWWKWSHNVHHIVTNAPEHDPDIEHLPFFAISHRFFTDLRSTYYNRLMKFDAFAKVMLRVQAFTYYPILALARFNLYFLSWDYLIAGRGPRKGPGAWHRWLELFGQCFFWTWYGYGIIYRCIPDGWTRFGFFMISQLVASPVHLQIVQSHFAMSTADLGPHESFPQKMLRTTMDVDCPPWLDFAHGGLQFQVIHHLFPRVPRHNLRKTQKLVQDFCDEVGIPYALYGFASCNGQVIGRLAEVSQQAAILAKCQQHLVQTGDYLGH